MTHLTKEARTSRATGKTRRATMRDSLVNSIFNPYTFLCLILLIGGVAVAWIDAKGIPLLLVAATLAAVLRLLWTIREELREANSNTILHQQRVELLMSKRENPPHP